MIFLSLFAFSYVSNKITFVMIIIGYILYFSKYNEEM